MIRISIDEAEHRITVTGHAGYADAGQDIVCAGASMLFYALAAALQQAGALRTYKSEPGDCVLTYRPSRANRRRLEVFRAGAELLARNYPQHVSLSGGEH